MSGDTKRTFGIVGGLLTLAGLLLLVVPATNIWPWVLGFWAVGLGLLISAGISQSAEVRQHQASRHQP